VHLPRGAGLNGVTVDVRYEDTRYVKLVCLTGVTLNVAAVFEVTIGRPGIVWPVVDTTGHTTARLRKSETRSQ
jgi:hypothetical protein